jgi:alkanesulfonate monooxygenase SsuD/methylene tetrahydromethanopterin reductase-like flavin-dependent oxidoreductase (luciferase family)
MKVLAFQQLAYRHLPPGFSEKYTSVVTPPYFELVEAEKMHEAHVHFLDEMMHAARVGFDGLGVTEHSQAAYDILPNPNLLLAALAYGTQAEGLKPALACVGRSLGKTKEPLRVAEEFSVIDQISGGRMIAGFPISLSYDSNQNQGIPPIETRPRFAENLALIERALKEEKPFPFNGQFSKHPYVNIWPRPVQRKLPIWAPAVGNPVTLKGILERDQVFLYPGWFGPRQAGSAVFKRYWEMAEEVGRDANPYRLAFLQTVAVGETDAEAHREYGPHIENGFRNAFGAMPPSSLSLPGYHDIKGVEVLARNPVDFGLVPKMKTIKYSELVDAQCAIVGSAETVADQLIELVRDFRIGSLLLMTQMGSMPTGLVKKNMSLIAQRVMPKLKQAWQDIGFESQGWKHHWWPARLS